MRMLIFRIAAGILAFVFAWFLAVGNHAGQSYHTLLVTVTITVVFTLFSVFGPRPAEWLLGLFIGDGYGKGKTPEGRKGKRHL